MSKEIALADILKELSNVSGFRISIYDTEQNELEAYPKKGSAFCQFIQKNPKALSLCHKNDKKAFETAKQTGNVYLYQCCFGLYEAVAPLYHNGILSGYLMMGQTMDTMHDSPKHTFQSALPFVQNPEELKQTVSQIPIRSKSQILSCISIMEICAAYITLSNRLKLNNQTLPVKIKEYIHTHFSSQITLDQLCGYFYCSRATLTITLSNRLKLNNQTLPVKIKEYIHTHFSSQITLDQLCGYFYCSRATLTKSFRNAYQQSILEYITSYRLQQSKRMLEDPSLSIQSIARQCGFSDQNYFTKVFHQKCGLTPLTYRNQMLKTSN